MSNLYVDTKNGFMDVQMQNASLTASPLSVMTAVNLSESKISTNPSETLVAFSIGSGIGVSMYDAVTGVGAVLNFILPDSAAILPQRAAQLPCMFADTGMHTLLDALQSIGVKTETIKIVIAGGAHILDQPSGFNMGLKNHQAITSILSNNNLVLHHEDVGGSTRRTLSLDIGTGCSTIQTLGKGETYI
jgi:chemotaxis protein CheD